MSICAYTVPAIPNSANAIPVTWIRGVQPARAPLGRHCSAGAATTINRAKDEPGAGEPLADRAADAAC